MSKPTVIKSGALCKSCGAWLPFESHGTYCGNFGSLGIGNRPNGETMTTQKTPDEVADELALVARNLKGDPQRIAKYVYKMQCEYVRACHEEYSVGIIAIALRAAREAALDEAANELVRISRTHPYRETIVECASFVRALKKGKV